MVQKMGCTQQQISYLNEMKTNGEYVHFHQTRTLDEHERRVHRETLWHIVYLYCQYRNIITFKARYFNKEAYGRNENRWRVYHDIPLTNGELKQAIKYGNEKGFLRQLNNSNRNHAWRFII